MRRTLRLFANVKPARYLEAGTPTGLTGLFTHNSPRSSLLFLYSTTLEKLQKFPESSLYRQSVEAVTKHRMSILESTVPPGYEEWCERARKILEQNPDEFHITGGDELEGAKLVTIQEKDGSKFIAHTNPELRDVRNNEWDGEPESDSIEGLRGPEERETPHTEMLYSKKSLEIPDKVKWESEPQMTADQVEEVEKKIGAGLIEEVVQMAESELTLVDIMYQAKVWENLEEQPPAGQWEYFERKSS